MLSDQELTREWVESFIIGENICPFAKRPYENGLIKIIHSNAMSEEEMTQAFSEEIQDLKSKNLEELSNSLLFFPRSPISYYDLLDLNDYWSHLIDYKQFKTIVFHRDFHFRDTDPNARVNLVNRSPFPMIHLLRTPEVESAANSEKGLKVSMINEEKLDNWDNQKVYEFIRRFNLPELP
jgi:hypothetical protein